MSNCLIVGAGTTKANAHKCTPMFTIGTNLHYANCNIIFAQDDPIINRLLSGTEWGFEHQPIFTTPQKYRIYKDYNRCLEFNYRQFYNCSSLSSGLNAIVLAQFFGFKHIFLAGFNFAENDKNYSFTFDNIKGKYKYTFL